ncbi:NAD(P)-dependent oxidoreductase [Helcococcus kunzii]|uniref:NAD(P)-dependent oxidoreductase n=1 Tax=Helcococcus kunzii TaxID=40091 RepID=UPI0021A68CCA|nr:NAD(P)-dependent oxidoreductase [Helcococcus kunzii]MCT1795362.1 NAD(P)-binding domain-containing protein [Helcococcus kunzii]MCT1989543.1 NAD(P)-binding domain-containing protein [Helcococcus kunzii]
MKIRLIEPLGVSNDLLDQYREILSSRGHDFKYYNDKAKDLEEQKKRISDADIIMIASSPLPGEAFKDNPNLKYINVAFTGFDHIDLDEAHNKGIKISNASGYSNTSVKELVLGMVLNIYRKISSGNIATREQKTHEDYYVGTELKGKTVGILGTGSIGIEVAKLFLALGCNVVAYNRSEKEELINYGVTYMSLDDVYRHSDIITIHLPLNKKTRGLVNKSSFKKMKPSAVLINCARGPIINNDDLADTLNNNQIAYAGVDVFDMEPPIPADYPLLKAKNTLLTPHIAYLTKESMIKRARIAFDNLISYLDGNPKNIIN